MKPRALPVLAALACVLTISNSASASFLFKPDIHGDRVVFTSEGDLWLGSLKTMQAERITSAPGVETDAHFSPDGKTLAFTAQYDGNTDVYVMPVEGGAPKRLTYDPYGADVLGWTPDGQDILFKSRRFSPTMRSQLCEVSVRGGLPQLLPIPQVEFAAMNRDGERVAYVPVSASWQHWYHYQGGQADQLWITDITHRTFTRLTYNPGVNTSPIWVGSTLYCVAEHGGVYQLCRFDMSSGRETPVTSYPVYGVSYPSTDGKRVVFQHAHGIALYDPSTGSVRELPFQLHSDRIHARAHWVSLLPWFTSAGVGPTGKRVIVAARGQLMSVPVKSGDSRVVAPLPGSRSQMPEWSADGKEIAFISDRSGEDEVWVCPADGTGEPRQLTKEHRGPLGHPVWSPDGKWIAVGDRDMRFMLVNVATGDTTLVDQGDRGGSYDDTDESYRFSPDSRWLTYSKVEPNWFSVVYLYNIETKQKVAITSSQMNSFAPVFDTAGKFLLCIQERNFDPAHEVGRIPGFDMTSKVTLYTLAADTPSPFVPVDDEEGAAASAEAAKSPEIKAKPASETAKPPPAASTPAKHIKVDLDGISERQVDVPFPEGRYDDVEATAARIFVIDRMDSGSELQAMEIKTQKVTALGKAGDVELTADGKMLYLEDGSSLQVIDAGTGAFTPGEGKVDLGGLQLNVEPEKEWGQIFHESWRIARDFFYDPNMHGLNWTAVERKYEPLLEDVGDRSDLNVILGDMIAELNVGHAYVGGGDSGPGMASEPMGYLGADLEPVPNADAFRIGHIYGGDGFDLSARSPLLGPGLKVREGDYILAVAGQPVSRNQDIQALLIGAANHLISLTVNSKPAMAGSWEVRVKPMASEYRARYYDWVQSRRDYVRKYAGPDVAYIHIPDMGGFGMSEFNKHYYPDLQKNAIIYDVRNNGGGYISGLLLVQMATKPFSYFKPRYGASWTRFDWGFAGYSVALCNEESGSDAEEFCDAFQRLKLGPVVGARTWGGEVGSGGGYRLIDNGAIFIPNYGEWVPDHGKSQWVIEGHGVTPDDVVEQDPASVLAGRDPQLDKSIAILLREMRDHPIVKPQPPPFPVKAFGLLAAKPGGAPAAGQRPPQAEPTPAAPANPPSPAAPTTPK